IPHAPSAYLAKQIIRKNNRIKDLKTVTTLHGTDITLLGMDRSFLNLIKFSIDESDGTTSVSKYLRNRTYGEFKPNRKIEVIPNFVDTEKYRPHDKPEDSSHGFLSRITPNHEKLIMHISNFRPVKRVGDVVKIFAKVRENINAKLLLIGDGPERRMCEQLVQDFGLDEHVVFLGKQEAVAELICCAHVFLLPSEEESFGLAALEAMAAGVPCVTSNAGGLSEVNIHNETGYLEKIGDVDAMAADVVKILTDQDVYQRFRANARQRVVDNFGTDRVVQQYIDYYQKVIEGKNT
ncbi:MAG TPA: N-acetyl-alpha-D-glucosaminyl L-malate synthase BshA, partial [bacterium]|nr:N-acetyl-alpha-D-glucosaminyl L-malate synthase BshA [bacterium]